MIWNPPFSPIITTVLVLAALAAVLLSFVFSRKYLNPATPSGLTAIVLRLVAFLLMLFFLLQPARLPEPKIQETRRAFAVLVDTSASMQRNDSQAGAAPTRLEQARKLLADHRVFAQVEQDAELSIYTFDADVTPVRAEAMSALNAQGKFTDLGSPLEKVAQLHKGKDLAGMLVLTDGRQTFAGDPLESARRLNVPVLVMPVGRKMERAPSTDGGPAKDLAVASVTAQSRLILGREALVGVTVEAQGYDTRNVTVELLEDNRPVQTASVLVSGQQTRRFATFTVQPTTLGTHRYTVRIAVEPGESDPGNNEQAFAIDVIDPLNRLLYFDRLRVERKFIKDVIESRRNLRYLAILPRGDIAPLVQGNDPPMIQQGADLSPERLRQIKAIILGDLPATAFTPQQLLSIRQWVDKGGSLVLLAGPESVGDQGLHRSVLAAVLPVTLDDKPAYIEQEFRVRLTEAGKADPAFQKVKTRWEGAAPLLSRFDIVSMRPGALALFDTAEGAAPLVATWQPGAGKVAIVLTDSTWRWQLGYDPTKSRAAEGTEFEVFWKQMIDWLLPPEEEKSPEAHQVELVALSAGDYQVNDEVPLMVSVRDAQGKAVTDASVDLVINTPDHRPILRAGKLEAGADRSVFTASFQAYAPGRYTIKATARQAGQLLGADETQINVTQDDIETTQTDPDPDLLRAIADATGGRVLTPTDLDRIGMLVHLAPRQVKIQPNMKTDAVPQWDRWWFLLAFMALVTGEWIVRRRNQWV